MILAELKRLAETDKLIPIPHYEPERVAYVVVLDQTGKCLNVEELKDKNAKGARSRGKLCWIPKRSERTSGPEAEFLVDKAEYVFGVGDKAAAKRRGNQELFLKEVRAATEATKDQAVTAVCHFLEKMADGKAPVPKLAEMAGGDVCAFRVYPDVEGYVHDRDAVREYWARLRISRTVSDVAACTVCGKKLPQVIKHPGVKLPGGNTAGAKLVSSKEPACWSYGFETNENAPVCLACSDAYTTALDRLMNPEYPRYPGGEPLGRRNYRLSADTVAVYWARGGGEFADIFAELLDGSPEAVHALLGSPWHGRAVALDNSEAFYVLILSGAQGRVILRDWFASTVRDVAANLKRYFDDLALVRQYANEPEALPLWQMLKSLVPPGKSASLPPALATGLFEAALYGHRYQLALLDAALRRLRAGAGLDRPRVAIIKAVLKRNFERKELKETMDTQNTNVGYRLGRLFAVLEKLQYDAIKPKSNIVDRFYGAASTTPVIVFPRLMALAQHHAAKLERGGTWYQKLIEEVVEPLNPAYAFPSALSLEEQGLFALGYYHQRAKLWEKKTAKPEPEVNNKEENQ